MSTISKKNKNKTKVRSEPQGQTSTLAYWLQHDDILCPTGYKPLSKNEEVIQCANIIADLVSSMTIMLMQNGENGDIRLKNELARKMDVNPNNFMVRKNFIYKIVKDMLLNGNSVARPSYKDGYLDNITLLKASSISFQQQGEEYRIIYNATSFAPDEVLHFVLVPNEEEPFRGEGYKNAIFETVKNLLQANATKTGFLQSKWKPSMIISINSDIEDLQDKDKRRKIVGSYTDTTEAGEPWLIPTGEIDVKTIQPLTLNDLAIQESITLDKRTIAAAFQIPPFMVGVGSFNKDEYNNFVSTKIMSIAMILQQELTRKLLYSNDKYFKFNPKSLMQYNLSEKTAFVKEMVGGGMMNRNEGRNEFDYSPVDNEGMNDFNVLENYIPVSDVGKQKKLIKEGEKNE
ncbi:phage portal protein [Sporanaerobium hydrogeniformans]|uniref:Phage portal protein n=1 Tax=Sporanaerobium hydrogeniformans TaxID=3072179 RepID=A0AC61DGE1_9FIRM|nr:phage portal protein [Sporanaerobium hydrogeniformans]PHV71905.1 phage portal protein [Sporanaerobium hydrogeniformans]